MNPPRLPLFPGYHDGIRWEGLLLHGLNFEIQFTRKFSPLPAKNLLHPDRCQPHGRFQLKFRYQCQWMINEGIQPIFEFPPPPIFFNIIIDRVFSAFTHFNCAWFISLFHQFHLSEKNESYEKESEGCQILTFLLIFFLCIWLISS